MKLKFKVQPYQTEAVESVVDCFAGQPGSAAVSYRVDPGDTRQVGAVGSTIGSTVDLHAGFRNADVQLSDTQVLENVHKVQRRQNLPLSDKLVSSAGCKFNLDVEMETGTGKTYCYIKSIFEMNKRYGWSKFIIVVPSIAIREGVYKSLEITAEHFTETYGKRVRYFIYNSKQLHHLESFSSDAGINVMVINIQAFASRGADNRRIYDELDDFQSRKPIDVIASNRPILILDEPQKMEGRATLASLEKFRALMILRYSATHRTTHNRVHRLDALDAYNQKLVKKIAVRGIKVKGLAGTTAYLYLEAIEVSNRAPLARMEIEVKQRGGTIKRVARKLGKGANLYDESGSLDEYREFVITQIDANTDTVEFGNGLVLTAGEATGDVTEETIRRIQIRETIRAHLDREQQLFAQGVKVLSLFFIDSVAKYRDYDQQDEKGDYARIFEKEYEYLKDEVLGDLLLDEAYRDYLDTITADSTHNGYFSIDKKTRHLADPKVARRGENAGLSDDVNAYDLILKDKERLLSIDEPTRFIFSHSALREGWDNPNVFVMCMLKHSDNTISRRQEVGRGMRLCVNQHGDRIDHPAVVHDVNVLTVVASESYHEFVANLQKEISESLSARPCKADEAYFTGKVLQTDEEQVSVTPAMSKQIYRYLLKHDYTDDDDRITDAYHDAKAAGALAELPGDLAPFTDAIFKLIDSVFSESQLPKPDDDRGHKLNPLNDNYNKKEFKALWERINGKAVYRVDFDSAELISNCIRVLDSELKVTQLQYTIQRGQQTSDTTPEQLSKGDGFEMSETTTESYGESVSSVVEYDLLGKISEHTQLTRKTVATILRSIHKLTFDQFMMNPEHFISEASRLINEQKAGVIIERLSYDTVDEVHDTDIFTAGQNRQDFSKASARLNKHIYDYAIVDSNIEREFVRNLDTSNEIVVYAKLPRGFQIPTPVGDYNPDWAISFKEGSVKHIYFIAETKGSMSSLQLRAIEKRKIDCAKKFFQRLNKSIATDKVKYDVVTDYEQLMELVK